jgi:hypothetical protein
VALTVLMVGCAARQGNPRRTAPVAVKVPKDVPHITYPVFDVPPLVGKNIDEIRTILGRPDDKMVDPTKAIIDLAGSQWTNEWKKNGEGLLVTYDARTRQVADFFLCNDDPDHDHLVRVGNLNPDSSDYTIKDVPHITYDASTHRGIVDPSQINGITVAPAYKR